MSKFKKKLKELNIETDELKEGDVYINMHLTDKDLFSKEHFEAVKAVIVKHDDVSHIVSNVFLHTFNSIDILPGLKAGDSSYDASFLLHRGV